MTRKILDWCDKKEKELMDCDLGDKTVFIKAAGLGFIEGAIDGAVVVGTIVAATGVVEIVKAIIKK